MSSTRFLNHAGGAVLGLLCTLAGCNAIVGLDKIEIVPDQPMAGTGNGGGNDEGGNGGLASSGTGGDVIGDGGDSGGPPVGDCETNQECTDRLTAAGEGVKGKDGKIAAACIKKPAGHCVALLSED